jgi:hypothetical protein
VLSAPLEINNRRCYLWYNFVLFLLFIYLLLSCCLVGDTVSYQMLFLLFNRFGNFCLIFIFYFCWFWDGCPAVFRIRLLVSWFVLFLFSFCVSLVAELLDRWYSSVSVVILLSIVVGCSACFLSCRTPADIVLYRCPVCYCFNSLLLVAVHVFRLVGPLRWHELTSFSCQRPVISRQLLLLLLQCMFLVFLDPCWYSFISFWFFLYFFLFRVAILFLFFF